MTVSGIRENMTGVSRTQSSMVKWDSSGQFRQILDMSDCVSFSSVVVPFIVRFDVCFPRYFEYFLHCDGLMTALFISFTVEIIFHSLSLSKASPTLMISRSLQYWKILRTNSLWICVNPFSQAILKMSQDITNYFQTSKMFLLSDWCSSEALNESLTLNDHQGQVQINCV